MLNYYKILGVSKSSGSAEIKDAFRKLSMQKHPDKGGNLEEYQKIVEAYGILCDKEKRKEYDLSLNRAFIRVRPKHRDKISVSLFITTTEGVRGCVRDIEYGKSVIQIRIGCGVKNGETVAYENHNNSGVDVYATVFVIPEEGFSFETHRGRTVLVYTLKTNKKNLGKKVRINLFGEAKLLALPNNLKDGDVVKVKGLGYPDKDGKRGYLFVRLHFN